MTSVMNLLRTTVLLSIVTTVISVTSWDTARNSKNYSTLFKRLSQPVNRVVGKNFYNNQRRGFDSNRKFYTNFEDNKNIINTMLTDNHKQFNDYHNPDFIRQNAFKCPPCVCTNISSNSVSVFCGGCSLTGIPQNWPVELEEIFISTYKCEKLEVLDLSTLLIYTSLTRVHIMTFTISKVFSTSHLNVSSTLIDLDLGGNKISTVEESCFILFTNLLKLSLRYNKIENLTKEMFTGLRNLSYLSVAKNKIKFIANDTFDDMENLVTLDISENMIIYKGDDLFPVRIFIPLRNLEELYINDMCQRGAYQCGSYPNKALQVLTKLRLLTIDGADRRGLGPEIKSLVHLRRLIITYPESDNFTDESYFDNVPFITALKFYMIEHNMHPIAIAKLTHLVNLTYYFSSISRHEDICKVLSDIKYFPKSSLKYLTLSYINEIDTGCKELNAQQAIYLKLFNLIELDLSNNYLVYLSPDFIAMLPKTLKKIDLSFNLLFVDLYKFFSNFPPELIEIDLSYQDYGRENDTGISHNFISKEKTYYFEDQTDKNIDILKISLPPKLQILKADNFRNFGKNLLKNLDRDSNYSLKFLSLTDNQFDFNDHEYLLPTIETAYFSNNRAQYFDKDFFPKNNSLKHLSISNNQLGAYFEYDTKTFIFAATKKLIVLDISSNCISEVENDYFRNLFKLQVLDISENKLQIINISFSHMTELRFLDLSSNSITTISKQSRDDLDLIAAHHQVYLDLTSNPLPCTCEGLELMKWMAFTNVYLLNHDFLVCRNEFRDELEIGNIVQRVETLQRQCASKTVIILTCAFSIIGFGILLIASMMYRYRWKLRYLRSIALVKLLGTRPGAANNMIGYRFDAYILYTDDTRRFVLRDCVRELEEKRGHRLCIEERDFLPGIYNVSQIVSSVQNSTKTVAMVTPEFYEGEYSEYGVKMALIEEIFMRRAVLFLCVCEPTDDKDLSHDLLTAMKQNNYIEYPPRDNLTDEIIEEFWNQFSRAIGRNEREEI